MRFMLNWLFTSIAIAIATFFVPGIQPFGFAEASYLENGSQKIGEGVYGKSITDPCIGWQETERLVKEIAELF